MDWGYPLSLQRVYEFVHSFDRQAIGYISESGQLLIQDQKKWESYQKNN
jgi:hypothetical protein